MYFISPSGTRAESSLENRDRLIAAGWRVVGEEPVAETRPKPRRAPRKKTANEAQTATQE